MTPDSSTSFEKTTELGTESPTLIEGLPGLGLVAAIAVDQITKQLELDQHGTIVSDDFPPVAAFDEGRVRDAVRVYAGEDPAVMTLQSDVPIPPTAVDSLSRCVLHDLSEEFERAIFLAGAPAESEDEIGEVVGVATTDDLETALADAGITLADGSGVVGGVTGALLADCYHDDIPAAVLIVRSNPYIPDPAAARAVIEEALESLVEFDIDTQELREQAEEIQKQKQQIAEQLRQYQQQQDQQPAVPGMYQ
ncbi:proteasome assembly chaperone family protein [Salinigranum marinum]|uniref:proteasome assembly chaperone family protein n=1 Tax=Salinigranum marinum TaxID=1515595 RepID=UPI002989C1AB|nr:PAC2 family protein [Salinigranum marinum]